MAKNDTASRADALTPAECEAIAAMSFEGAMKELETIVRKLEGGNSELESAIADYARGMALKDHCLQKLAGARLKVEALMKSENGTVSTQPFDAG